MDSQFAENSARKGACAEVTFEMQSQVDNRMVEALRNIGLSPFSAKIAIGFIKNNATKEGGAKRMGRVLSYLLDEINQHKQHSYKIKDGSIDWQYGCPERIRGLRARPVWPAGECPFAMLLQQAFPLIKAEFLAARKTHSASIGARLFQPYRSPRATSLHGSPATHGISLDMLAQAERTTHTDPGRRLKGSDEFGDFATDAGDWNVCYLQLHGIDFTDNLLAFPQTAEVIRSIPRCYQHSFFSALAPGSHITPHFGPSNKKLRCMLPLVVPDGSSSGSSSGGGPDSSGGTEATTTAAALATQQDLDGGGGHAPAPSQLKLSVEPEVVVEQAQEQAQAQAQKQAQVQAQVGSEAQAQRMEAQQQAGSDSCSSSSSSSSSNSSNWWLRVADQKIILREGQCIVFDDSFQHEAGQGYSVVATAAANAAAAAAAAAAGAASVAEGSSANSSFAGSSSSSSSSSSAVSMASGPPRVVLIVDVWHPDFTDEEVKILSFIGNAQMAAAKKMAQAYERQLEAEKGHLHSVVDGAAGAAGGQQSEHTEEAAAGAPRESTAGVALPAEQAQAQQAGDFLSVILKARRLAVVPPEAVWGAKVVDD